MANVFTNDPRFDCVLRFESSGDALGTDSLGLRNWTVNPAGGAGMRSNTVVLEGSYSLLLDSSTEFLTLADIATSTTFPFMSGNSTKKGFFYFRYTFPSGSENDYLLSKYRALASSRSFLIRKNTTNKIDVLIGRTSTDTPYTVAFPTAMVAGTSRKYHISAQGTKTAGQTWTVTIQITLS